jgi:two-component system NtrC family sensor kinase
MTQSLEAGADDFVGKSSDMAVLKARIRALLRRKFFSEENRRIGEQLLRKELEVTEARAARQVAEARAVMAEELERKNKELEAFSYSVSHDLRAPLRSINGFSTALLEDYAGKLDAKGQEYLGRVRTAADRMGELIDDLLDLSRVGRADLQRERVDLSALARTVAREIQRVTPGRQARFLIPDAIVADADRRLLRVALENLLGNAWKFTANAAEAVIEFGAVEKDGGLTYFVRDNGAGFDMHYMEKLFAPFQRLHTEAEFPGTGIGLATVYRIVERHGGRVWAEGVVGKGATFFWTLPPPQHRRRI